MSRIAVIGNWHLAFVTAAGLAELGHEVILLNHDVKNPWTHSEGSNWMPKLGLDEPGLEESMAKSVASGRLKFDSMRVDGDNSSGLPWNAAFAPKSRLTISVTLERASVSEEPKLPSQELPIIWLAIDTPLFDDGSPDVEPLVAALLGVTRGPCGRCGRVTSGVECHQCSPRCMGRASLIVISSQVPIGFCEKYQKQSSIPVACVPENYRFGKAMGIFRSPDRIVIGAQKEETRQVVRGLFAPDPITGSVRYGNVIMCDLPTAEMIKHATNAFLGTCISFANEMAKVGKAYGADMSVVEAGLRADRRVGQGAPVRPGGAFTGDTLRRDLRALQRTGVGTPLVDAVLEVNDAVLLAEKS